LTADSTTFETESSILEKIAQEDSFDLGKQHIISLQDHFKHSGPNGEHGCLVFEVMGPSTATMVDHLPKDVVSKIGPYRYPMWMARSILRQALLGIDFLHRIGIVHGDLQPGNLLFAATDIQSVEESRLSQEGVDPSSLVPLERRDGKVDLWAPPYLALNQPIAEFVELDFVEQDPNFVLKISDMGEGLFYSSENSE
jgi:serine/threonine protein kinase